MVKSMKLKCTKEEERSQKYQEWSAGYANLWVDTLRQQAQLLNIILDPKDVVYTPDWVADDMVSFFQPSGKILEPSKGEGVFLKYLPPEHGQAV